MASDPTFKLEFRPAPEPPPPTLIIRRKKYEVPVVMTEDEGFELYLILKAHYEGDICEQEAKAAAGRDDPLVP